MENNLLTFFAWVAYISIVPVVSVLYLFSGTAFAFLFTRKETKKIGLFVILVSFYIVATSLVVGVLLPATQLLELPLFTGIALPILFGAMTAILAVTLTRIK